ncbi:hypothetical protein E4T38_09637 [Aureobasidium subglaciale]|nr:hypothetical protein E4T38_09637 [Aureobasidium subglaciale]KAI5213653.1 hypothetical protein E4T40_09579 [Aureobasidium subglaciale]KAI5215374.1 hypothetical protein E4T41_09617 [Aureobasidium subglaciale]KAI5253306.1 hypothetical protein E4T46_09594 [Aureobasidium subglaciale]
MNPSFSIILHMWPTLHVPMMEFSLRSLPERHFWSASGSGFVLVTYTDGCHGSSDQQRTFWMIDSLELLADSLSILAAVESELAIENALYEVDLQWGTYYPSNNSTNGTASSNGSGAGASTTNGSGPSPSGSGSSNSTANGAACGIAPSSVIDGLPAANCGDGKFDQELDDAIGYLDFSSNSADGSSLSDFLPDTSVSSEDLTDAEDGTTLSRRALALQKRWNPFKAIARAVTKVVKTVVQVYTAPVRLIATAIRHIPVVGDFIAKQTEFDPSISGSKDFNFGPDADADSPWGKATQIYSKSKTSESGKASGDITVFCVDCGVKGHIALAGQAKFNILDGLHGLSAAVNANLVAGVNLGLVAHAQYSDTKSKALVRAPLPEVGVAVKGVFSAGVYLSVDAVSTIAVTAEGQALVGVVMTIPNFQANINLFDQDGAGKSSISGLNPTFEKRFEASAEVSASLTLALPIAINCGFEIPALSLKRAISLIEQPSLYGKLTVAGSTSNTAPASATCNNGLEYFANFQNDVNLDFLGLKIFNLNHYDSPPLLQGCKAFASKSSSSSLVSSASSESSLSSDSSTVTSAMPTSEVSSSSTISSATTDGASTAVSTTGASSADSSTTISTSADVSTPASTTDSISITSDASSAQIVSETPVTSDMTTVAAPTSIKSAQTTEDSTTATSASVETTPPSALARRSTIMRRQDNSTSSDEDTVIANDDEDTFASTDSVTNGNLEVDDESSNADGAEFQDGADAALGLSADEQDEDGISFTTLIDVQQTFQIIPGDDGNLYAGAYTAGSTSDTGLFAQYDGVIFGDDGQRVLHFYPDEMAVYNVSRIRLSSDAIIPKSADAITLSPIDYDDADSTNPLAYFAVTTKQQVYSLVLCSFSNGADSKVFVVNDQSGLDALTGNGNIVYTVTGAPVQVCSPLAMISGGNGTVSA